MTEEEEEKKFQSNPDFCHLHQMKYWPPNLSLSTQVHPPFMISVYLPHIVTSQPFGQLLSPRAC